MSATTLTEIYGNAIPALTGDSEKANELFGVVAVPVTPPHMARAVVQRPYGLFATTTERMYIPDTGMLGLSGQGTLKAIRLRASSTDLDLSGSNITVFQVCIIDGSTSLGSHEIRDRSENIAKSRLVASGDFFDLLFTDPPAYQPGDFIAIRCKTSSGFSIFTNTAINCYPLKASEFFGATTASSATYTDASATFQTDAAADDWATIYNGGDVDNYRHAQITSIASQTSLNLTGTAAATDTGHDMVIGDHAPQSGIATFLGDSSGDGPFATIEIDERFAVGNLEIVGLAAAAPTYAIGGSSVPAGHNPTADTFGSPYSHTNGIRDYSASYDLGRLFGNGAVSVAVGASKLADWIGSTTWSTGAGDFDLAENYQSLRPTYYIHDTVANDCKQGYSQSGYEDDLDDLKTLVEAVGSKLVLTTGTPLPGRDAGERTAASNIRGWIRAWGAVNGVQVLDTEPRMRDTTEDTLPSGDDSGDGVHLSAAGMSSLAAAMKAELAIGRSATDRTTNRAINRSI